MTVRDDEIAEAMFRIAAYDAGARHAHSHPGREYPLSGEWAGESIPEMSHYYGTDLEKGQYADEFEAGYFANYEEPPE